MHSNAYLNNNNSNNKMFNNSMATKATTTNLVQFPYFNSDSRTSFNNANINSIGGNSHFGSHDKAANIHHNFNSTFGAKKLVFIFYEKIKKKKISKSLFLA